MAQETNTIGKAKTDLVSKINGFPVWEEESYEGFFRFVLPNFSPEHDDVILALKQVSSLSLLAFNLIRS